MKKTLMKIVVIGFVVAVMAGCTNDPDPQMETAAKPAAAPAGGEVADNTPVTLTSETAGAVIYYTQDGTEPGTASTLYSDTNKPLIITGKLTLKAIAVKDGMNNSAVLTAVYTIEAEAVNKPPTASAGSNQTVQLSGSLTVTLNGSGADEDGTVESYEWSCTNKPGGATDPTIQNGKTASATISGFNKAGDYKFQLVVTDNDGAVSAPDFVTVNVQPMTKDVTVPIMDTLGNPLSFVQTYTPENGWTSGFASGDITYILAVDDTPLPTSTTTVAATGFSAGGHTITQTFYYDGKVVGTRSGTVTSTGGGTWNFIAESFPEIKLSLSKTEL